MLARISAAALAPDGRPLAKGDAFLVSFCRYDRTRGQAEPVLSSTSEYTVCSFHRQTEWSRLVLE